MNLLAVIDWADAAAVLAAVVAVLGILGPVRAWFNRTLGRRFDLYRRLERLGVGAHQSFFEAVIGEIPAIQRKVLTRLPDYDAMDLVDDDSGADSKPPIVERHFTEAIWVDPLVYAQTLADEDGTVAGFSVTTRVRRFAPRFAAPRPFRGWRWLAEHLTRGRLPIPALAHARLGRTVFTDVTRRDGGLPKVRCRVGARVFTYSEAWYFGNPGHYSEYVTSTNMASRASRWPEITLHNLDWPDERADPTEGFGPEGADGEPTLAPWIVELRSRVEVTTWTVIQFPLTAETWPASFGPHGDEVRTLP